jgi:hypothetical protein
MSMKNSIDTMGNRSYILPACSVVPQPTVPPCAPVNIMYLFQFQSKLYHNTKLHGSKLCNIGAGHILGSQISHICITTETEKYEDGLLFNHRAVMLKFQVNYLNIS